ncbi:MAG: heavy metal-binding domain-containing protein [Hyphomicrobiales bacterium]
MIISTTDHIPGHEVVAIVGIVAGEAVMGTNVFFDFFAKIRDVVGGRSGSYQKVLKEARDNALEDLKEEARSVGADAVIGIDLDYEVMGETGSILMVSANGTAVKLR